MDLDTAQQLLAAQRAGLALSAEERACAERLVRREAIRRLEAIYVERGKRIASDADGAVSLSNATAMRHVADQLRAHADTVEDFQRRAADAVRDDVYGAGLASTAVHVPAQA